MASKSADILLKYNLLSSFVQNATRTENDEFSNSVAWTLSFADNSNSILNYVNLSKSLNGILTGTVNTQSLNKEIEETIDILPFNVTCNGLIFSVDAIDQAQQTEITKKIHQELEKNSAFKKPLNYIFVKSTFAGKEITHDDLLCLRIENSEAKTLSFSYDKQETALFELSKQYFGILTTLSVPVVTQSTFLDGAKDNDYGVQDAILNFRNTDLIFSLNGEGVDINKDKLKDCLKTLKQSVKKSKDDFNNFLCFIPIQEATLLFSKTPKSTNYPNGILIEKKQTVLANEFEVLGYFRYEGDLQAQIQDFGKYINQKVKKTIKMQLEKSDQSFGRSVTTFINNYTGLGVTIPLKNSGDEANEQLRKLYHSKLHLPTDRPFMRACDSLNITRKSIELDTSGKLRDVHCGLTTPAVPGGTKYLIHGSYIYYHYMQDSFDDQGWGCAYRSLQTVLSWFKVQRLVPDFKIPSIPEIQKILVDLGDKPANFVGTKEWIGAFEVNLVLNKLLDVESKILFISSGAEIPSKARELKEHFLNDGTPIMIGGGVLAYTLLGIDYNEETGDIRYLILDPHYTGSDNLKNIQDKGWIGWKESKLFVDHAFYNFCLPQRKKYI